MGASLIRLASRPRMDQIATQTDYEFGGFRLNTALQVLIPPEGAPHPLSSRVFQTLLVLVQHAGETVDKRYLLRSVWPDVVVEENNLNQSIAALRRALGETAGDRRFILTVPGRGFRFIAPVKTVLPGTTPQAMAAAVTQLDLSETPPDIAPPAAGSSRSGFPRGWGAILAVVISAVICAIAAFLYIGQPRPVTRPAEYEQLTDDFESAGAPALSADGRFLAYVRGGGQFLSHGQIYVKALPSGEPVRLTNVDAPIYAPAFSPDGAQLAFTLATGSGEPRDWGTWTVPVSGGEPSMLLPNASGLTWLGPDRLMYSEVGSGIHMGIITTTLSRSDRHEVYFPAHERAMAHFSFASPDRRHVIVAQMSGAGKFEQCRLVPMEGGSPGRPVGPPAGCISAAWSPDGHWMYFAAGVEGHSHLWRVRFPDGAPEQITFGPTEETAVIAAPDGRSLISSIGTDNSSIWLHEPGGAKQLTTERLDYSPWLSLDGKRLYYLRGSPSHPDAELMRLNIPEQRSEALLPDFDVHSYDISADERTVVFATMHNGESQVWVAASDRHSAPKLLARSADTPFFAGGQVVFRQPSDQKNILRRVNIDGSHLDTILNVPILDLFGVSPDGTWVSAGVEVDHRAYSRVYNIRTGEVWSSRTGFGPVRWSADGKLLYVESSQDEKEVTRVLPFDAARPPEDLQANPAVVQQIPGEVLDFSSARDPRTYVFVKYERHRNIFRIPLH